MARHMFGKGKTSIQFVLCTLISLLGLAGCGTEELANVPVTEAWRQPLRVPVTYTVQPGDRLYSIAWMYGLDYRQIAQDNNIQPPAYRIHAGQQLRLRPQSSSTINTNKPAAVATAPQQPAAAPTKTTAQKTTATNATAQQQNNPPPVVTDNSNTATTTATTTPVATPPLGTTNNIAGITWTWPAQGKIINGFAPTSLNRGVDIAGKPGDPVLASAAGKVVYAGNGLRGYGQLIILKHNDTYLSAYAHNQKLLVKEGQTVRLGQKIATLGSSEAKSPMLHFEIRQNGKPVDPLKYLPTH